MIEFLDKKYIDLDYVIMRDEIIKYLLDYDKSYSLQDVRKIRSLLKQLLNVLKRYKDD